MKLGKYSFGIGDRFGMEGKAQLRAIMRGNQLGIELVPVWNKSNREHQIIGTFPGDVRKEADQAVKDLAYSGPYYVDADHINEDTVQPFIEGSDFFTLDVAGYIGKPASGAQKEAAMQEMKSFLGQLIIPGIGKPFEINEGILEDIIDHYQLAISKAGDLYRMLCAEKGQDNFIAEVSMDGVEKPQRPLEMFFMLALMAREDIRAQTIAPKFSGRFNKGVDYVGDREVFRKEFEEDLLVIDYAIKKFGLPENLKLSIHSGSDKFSIYPVMGELIRKYDKGIHVKTAGTTWLEEVIGLALGDEESVKLVKEIYAEAFGRQQELCGPYADVIDIDQDKLPDPDEFGGWTGERIAASLRHIPDNPDYNLNIRQLIHVAYKLAAEKGGRFRDALVRNREIIEKQVEENIFDRHLKRLFA